MKEIHLRDTEDRRKLYYGHRAVTVAWELIHILHAHNHQLLKSLQLAKGNVEAVALAFQNFAAEKAYAVYSANHAEALLGLDTVLGATLLKYTKDHPVVGGLTVQRYLKMPFERFPQYVEFLQAIQALTADQPSPALAAATKAMEDGLKAVTVATNEFARQNELVNLQSQFMGYVDLYSTDRCLVKEGMLTKIYVDGSKRKPQERYTHLLSDALIYSTTLVGPYKYKLAKIHGLGQVRAAVPVAEDPTMFDLTKATGEGETIRFQAPDVAAAKEWVEAVNTHVAVQKAKAEQGAAAAQPSTQPRETRVNAVSFLKKHGLQLESMPERSKTIVYGIKADLTYIAYLQVFARVVGVTLDELSRGIGAVGGKRGTVENGDAERANGLFETKVKTFNQLTEGTVNRVKAAHAGKPLQSPEMAVFLKVLPVLEFLSQALVERLEERLTQHSKTGAELCIGDIYLDMSALFVAYQSYASVVDEAAQVLGNPALAELAESLGDALAPLTMEQHLTAPLEAAQRMALQMKAVLDMTPEGHADRPALELATLMMEQTAAGVLSSQQDTKDYWKLVAIRDAIGSMEFDSPLETLITSERKLILEGSLLKACRSKDKAYMFWLFTDILLYATQLPASQLYQLNRWMELTEMHVQASAQEATGLDVLTAEKSFTVFAKDPAERDMWLDRISKAIFEAKEAAGVSTDPSSLQTAPILVQTSDAKDCALCHTSFSLFMRKQHCLSCGNVVCDKCSPSRMVLANIHKTERQRVCNACVAGETHHIRAANAVTGKHGINPALAPKPAATVSPAPRLAPPPLVDEAEEDEEEETQAAVQVPFSPGLPAEVSAQVNAPSWLTSPQHSISAAASAMVSPLALKKRPTPVPASTAETAESSEANPFEGEGFGFSTPAVSAPAPAPFPEPEVVAEAPVVTPEVVEPVVVAEAPVFAPEVEMEAPKLLVPAFDTFDAPQMLPPTPTSKLPGTVPAAICPAEGPLVEAPAPAPAVVEEAFQDPFDI